MKTLPDKVNMSAARVGRLFNVRRCAARLFGRRAIGFGHRTDFISALVTKIASSSRSRRWLGLPGHAFVLGVAAGRDSPASLWHAISLPIDCSAHKAAGIFGVAQLPVFGQRCGAARSYLERPAIARLHAFVQQIVTAQRHSTNQHRHFSLWNMETILKHCQTSGSIG
jgi:hypothetical protein